MMFDSWGVSFGSPSAWGVAWLHSAVIATVKNALMLSMSRMMGR